jgi:hypothetical protein
MVIAINAQPREAPLFGRLFRNRPPHTRRLRAYACHVGFSAPRHAKKDQQLVARADQRGSSATHGFSGLSLCCVLFSVARPGRTDISHEDPNIMAPCLISWMSRHVPDLRSFRACPETSPRRGAGRERHRNKACFIRGGRPRGLYIFGQCTGITTAMARLVQHAVLPGTDSLVHVIPVRHLRPLWAMAALD